MKKTVASVCLASVTALAAAEADKRLAVLQKEESSHTIRPGGTDGMAFWNDHAVFFHYPPAFAFKNVPDATRYRFLVLDDSQEEHRFEADSPQAPLSPVWAAIPKGFTTAFAFGLDAKGTVCGLAGIRRFWRQAPFAPGAYPPAKRPYAEARRMIYAYILDLPDTRRFLADGKWDSSTGSNASSYPAKTESALTQAMIAYAALCPERKGEAMKLARAAADFLLARSQGPNRPLAFFPPTYDGNALASGKYKGMNMLLYPAAAGRAYLALYRAVGETNYLAAAEGIAATYLRLQGEDGTWHLKLNENDGTPANSNRAVPTRMIDFFEDLYSATGKPEYRAAADRAFAFIDKGPLTDWNWEGQFEDIRPADARYVNLTKHNACETAMYMLKRFPGDKRRLTQAREIMRFAEDQFVCWERPCRSDGTGIRKSWLEYRNWQTPCALEQYDCYVPIDASAAKLIRTWLALYAAEKNPLDLAKARALGDAITNIQEPNGRVRTFWVPDPQPAGGDWLNCMAASAEALGELDAAAPVPSE